MKKSHFSDIDHAVQCYIQEMIRYETSKELEDLVFFSSYTVNFDVFKKATQKLKKMVRHENAYAYHVWENDAQKVIRQYDLHVKIHDPRYAYLIQALIKAQIDINEAVMRHFKQLCQKAHSLEYIERRAEMIYALLADESMYKTSPAL